MPQRSCFGFRPGREWGRRGRGSGLCTVVTDWIEAGANKRSLRAAASAPVSRASRPRRSPGPANFGALPARRAGRVGESRGYIAGVWTPRAPVAGTSVCAAPPNQRARGGPTWKDSAQRPDVTPRSCSSGGHRESDEKASRVGRAPGAAGAGARRPRPRPAHAEEPRWGPAGRRARDRGGGRRLPPGRGPLPLSCRPRRPGQRSGSQRQSRALTARASPAAPCLRFWSV